VVETQVNIEIDVNSFISKCIRTTNRKRNNYVLKIIYTVGSSTPYTDSLPSPNKNLKLKNPIRGSMQDSGLRVRIAQEKWKMSEIGVRYLVMFKNSKIEEEKTS